MVAASAAAGSLYAVVNPPPDSKAIVQAWTGAAVGAVISLGIVAFELFAANRFLQRGGRHLPLVVTVLVRTVVYGIVIVAALLIVPWFSGAALSPARPGLVDDLIFSIVITFVFVTAMSVVQLIGPGVLTSLLVGRYYPPARGRADRALPRHGRFHQDCGAHRPGPLPRASLGDLHQAVAGGHRPWRRGLPLCRRRLDRHLAARRAGEERPTHPLPVCLPRGAGGGAPRPHRPARRDAGVPRRPARRPAGRRRGRRLQARDRSGRRRDEHRGAGGGGLPNRRPPAARLQAAHRAHGDAGRHHRHQHRQPCVARQGGTHGALRAADGSERRRRG